MEGSIIIIFIILAFYIHFIQSSYHKNLINEQVNFMGGTVISIERKTFSTGPFFLPGKGRSVYRFEYKIGDAILEGWAKFGGLLGPDWGL